jgi:tRNA1Val (adenine37-N6)-methyltransferase
MGSLSLKRNNMINENERIDDLECGNFKIIQNKEGYCFTSDAVLLANFVKANSKDVLVDLCTGSGVIPTLILAKTKLQTAIGVELQEYLFDLATRSAKLNRLEDNLKIINTDVKDAYKFIKKGSASIVTVNPPYELVEGHFLSDNEQINICKYETDLTLETLIKTTDELLKFGGKFYMIHKSSRLADIMYLLRKYKLEPKEIKFMHPKKGLNSNVVIIKAIKGAKRGLDIIPSLILTNEDNTYTEEVLKIYDGE